MPPALSSIPLPAPAPLGFRLPVDAHGVALCWLAAEPELDDLCTQLLDAQPQDGSPPAVHSSYLCTLPIAQAGCVVAHIRQAQSVAAFAVMDFSHTDRRLLIDFDLAFVAPEHRGQGLGMRLTLALASCIETAVVSAGPSVRELCYQATLASDGGARLSHFVEKTAHTAARARGWRFHAQTWRLPACDA